MPVVYRDDDFIGRVSYYISDLDSSYLRRRKIRTDIDLIIIQGCRIVAESDPVTIESRAGIYLLSRSVSCDDDVAHSDAAAQGGIGPNGFGTNRRHSLAGLRDLEWAAKRLKLDQPGGPPEGRVTLLHGSLTYRDERWFGVDAAALVEVIEHLDEDRLPALAEVVFGQARPGAVVVTTPNAEYNVLFPKLGAGAFRHPDHRFEWTRAQFRDWAAGIERAYGYRARFSDIGMA